MARKIKVDSIRVEDWGEMKASLELVQKIMELMRFSPLGGYTIPELCQATGATEKQVANALWDLVTPQPRLYCSFHPEPYGGFKHKDFTTATRFFPPHLL